MFAGHRFPPVAAETADDMITAIAVRIPRVNPQRQTHFRGGDGIPTGSPQFGVVGRTLGRL